MAMMRDRKYHTVCLPRVYSSNVPMYGSPFGPGIALNGNALA